MPVDILAYTACSAAGAGLNSLHQSIKARRSGLGKNNFDGCDLDTWVGRVAPVEAVSLPENLAHVHSRNNQLAWLGLQQDGFNAAVSRLVDQVGPRRIGIVMGTSTSSIGRTEEGYRNLEPSGLMPEAYLQPEVHSLHSPSVLVALATGIEGPALSISTACSSSAKVFITASRWIRHGLVDAVLVGGIDSLCLSVLYGFNSLQLLSVHPCRPFDQARDGINIGEAAGFALLTRQGLVPDAQFSLLGYGESSDAHHMSHPHPEGKGAVLAMQRAMQRAGVKAADIDYINLHGTATKANDLVESKALAQCFTDRTSASSTKGWTGHTLGAAGILESIITLESMRTGVIPGTLNCEELDPELGFPILQENISRPVRFGMTNSFGFGGNNASLVFGAL